MLPTSHNTAEFFFPVEVRETMPDWHWGKDLELVCPLKTWWGCPQSVAAFATALPSHCHIWNNTRFCTGEGLQGSIIFSYSWLLTSSNILEKLDGTKRCPRRCRNHPPQENAIIFSIIPNNLLKLTHLSNDFYNNDITITMMTWPDCIVCSAHLCSHLSTRNCWRIWLQWKMTSSQGSLFFVI